MNIIITGASRGIGYQTALSLCKQGITRLLLVSRNEASLEKLRNECQAISRSVEVQILADDLTHIVERGEKFLVELGWENCDILINNAGLLVNKPFAELEGIDIKSMFDINLFAPSQLVKLLLPTLLKSPSAHVLNVSSMGGYQGSSKYPGLSFYSASKAALSVLTECLAEEYKSSNVRFNCLALGAVQTEMLEEAFPGYQAPVSAREMGEYIADFALKGHKLYNGKILPVALSNP